MTKTSLAASLLVVALTYGPACARSADAGVCADTPNTETAIAACTRLYEKAGLSSHNRAIVLGNRAAAFKMLGKYDEAIADLGTAIDLEPRNPQYHCQRGDVLSKKNAFAEAMPDYDAAVKAAPRLAWARYSRGKAHLALGQPDLAVADFDEALRTKPGTTNYIFFRGRANAQRKQYDAAERDFKQVLASPDLKRHLPREQASVLTLHGFSLVKLKRAAEAKPDVEEALRLTPKNTFALTVMGAIERELGHKAEAKDYFQRALAIDPKAVVAQRALANLEKSQAGTAIATAPAPEATTTSGPENSSLTPVAKAPEAGPAAAAATPAASPTPAAPAQADTKVTPPAEVAKATEEPADDEPSTSAPDPEKSTADTPPPVNEPAKSAEPAKTDEAQKVAKGGDGDSAAPADDLCARYFPTVGQTLLVACTR